MMRKQRNNLKITNTFAIFGSFLCFFLCKSMIQTCIDITKSLRQQLLASYPMICDLQWDNKTTRRVSPERMVEPMPMFRCLALNAMYALLNAQTKVCSAII